MREIGYTTAGTVEYIFDSATRKFYFLEVNTRLQVEHGITELITGLDIVGIMIDVALGKKLPFKQSDIRPNRWALEVRLNAEDPKTFSPSFGPITRLQVPMGPNVRVASGVYEGGDIPAYYDSLFMLLMTAGADRKDAIQVMDRSPRQEPQGRGRQDAAAAAALHHPAPVVHIRGILHTIHRRAHGRADLHVQRKEQRGRGAQDRAVCGGDIGARAAEMDVRC